MTHLGELLEQIEIQTKSVVQTAYGDETVTWGTTATVWAKVETNRRAAELEQFIAGTGKERQRSLYRVTIHRDANLTITPEDNRVLWGGNAYDVEQVIDPDGRRQWVEIQVRAIK